MSKSGTSGVVGVGPSAKQQLVLTAERLFAQHGLDGVPLRRIGVEAGMANKSAVQYHFGSKDALIDAILVNRLEHLTRRRELLQARAPADDLRRVVEAQLLPVIELAEDETCYYLPFLEQLLRFGSFAHPLDKLPGAHRASQRAYVDRVGALISQVPQPLRDIRIYQASAICVHISADRHRARTFGPPVTPYALHVSQVLDGAVSLLESPPSDETLRALGASPTDRPALRALP
jgi:AcrR family transcriptional regulator